jgi:hypothetical protein
LWTFNMIINIVGIWPIILLLFSLYQVLFVTHFQSSIKLFEDFQIISICFHLWVVLLVITLAILIYILKPLQLISYHFIKNTCICHDFNSFPYHIYVQCIAFSYIKNLTRHTIMFVLTVIHTVCLRRWPYYSYWPH